MVGGCCLPSFSLLEVATSAQALQLEAGIGRRYKGKATAALTGIALAGNALASAAIQTQAQRLFPAGLAGQQLLVDLREISPFVGVQRKAWNLVETVVDRQFDAMSHATARRDHRRHWYHRGNPAHRRGREWPLVARAAQRSR